MRSRVRGHVILPMILAVLTWNACAPPPNTSTPEASTTPAASPAAKGATSARDAVLARDDLPAGCGLTSEREDSWDVIAYGGYVSGWLVFYECPATPSRDISLMADATAYSSADQARTSVAEAKAYIEAHGWGTAITLSETIGDAAVALQKTTPPRFADDVGYTIVFSSADMSYFLSVEGPSGTVDLAMVVGLAKRQLARSLMTR